VMMTVGVFLGGSYSLRAFLPLIAGIFYWPELAVYRDYFPLWYAPTDAEALRDYFQGGRTGVPWSLWAPPLLRWGAFFLAIFILGGSLVALFRKQWVEHERLSFPLLYLPLTLSADEGSAGSSILRGPFLWAGIGIAALFNAFNIGHALNPTIPKPGFYYSFSGQFPDAPYRPFDSVILFFMLEAIGFGYFVPLEISFSTWFFYLAEKLFAVAGLGAGYQDPGFPYLQDQSAGAYLGVGALLLFGARRHLAGVFRRAFGFEPGGDASEARQERAAVAGFLGSIVFILGWWWYAGFSMAVAVPFLALLLCFTLVYARLRAESGVPSEFAYPYGLPHGMLANWFTVRGLIDAGGMRSWVLLSNSSWLSRHHTMFGLAAYQADALKIAGETRMRWSWMYGALLAAFVAGMTFMLWAHLDTYYHMGSNVSGGNLSGEFRAKVALQEYQRMTALAGSAPERDMGHVGANLFGAGFALFLGVVRSYFVKSPFHPLGYILATAYGDAATNFFPMLIAWACKAMILKAGGLPLYRRFMPLFLGLIIGHFLIGGILWPLLSLLLAPEASQSYHLYFGG
jgi:hypothetical protein